MPQLVDQSILAFDRALRTLFGKAISVRRYPAADAPPVALEEAERRHVAGLMRVNHAGEVCAQALYQGQAVTARDAAIRATLERASHEEQEHLAWTEQRLQELGSGTSLLNPLWYAGSFAMGALAGAIGDRWSLGFVVETERQVEEHLTGHLEELPQDDARSRAIVEQMRTDEATHALSAQTAGAAELPGPIKGLMRLTARVMTVTAYRI
jgi:ubiquinone biosynthesis monooxygenase Coq7